MGSATPRPKVVASVLAGAITTMAVWAMSLAGLDVPAEVASAFTVVTSFLAAYFWPDAVSPGVG